MPTSLLSDLPAALAERCRALNDRAPDPAGDYVLLWAHHALRAHDNPALDLALHLGERLDRPVLVYQGLGGGHRYDSDRHHAFILQGARDFRQALAARGVRHVTHVPELGAGRGLADLLPRAATLVAEDFPAPPFPRWTRRWAARSAVACIAVDAACIVPMAASRSRPTRAYAFRQSLEGRFREALAMAWPEPPAPRPWRDDLPPLPAGIDWGGFDLADALSRCAIDHSLPPVADTVGGSAAGYARWEAFLRHGLGRYHLLRNDAAVSPPLGVSRLSPYLHYGMVSPWRLARDAQATGGPGADKFLDELWLWRELAWHWCWHSADVEAIDALPDWALETLATHTSDPRPWQSHEGLHRARSGEPLWDLAQASLLRHGELHNNLRMTWGKAVVGWSASTEQAMHRLRDLNHRFALDGNDPGSYGGLWWCLGLFDRPFDPPQPVFGRVRTRSLHQHAKRLDLPAYAARVARGSATLPRVAVVGAGLAGAAATQALLDQGYRVTVVDKSRGVGGRMSTRRSDLGPFDHGAQFLRAHDPRFRRQVERWVEAERLLPWTPSGADGSRLEHAWVAAPAMNDLVKPLLDGATLMLGRAVAGLQRTQGLWRLFDADGGLLTEAEQLIVTAPAPQAASLLETPAPALARRIGQARYSACWAAMLELAADVQPDRVSGPDPIGWAAADASRPGRPAGRRWVAHASPEWSNRHLDDEPASVGRELSDGLSAALGVDARVVAVHRWRYALVERPLGVEHLVDAGLGLRAAGDYCLGGRLEAAWLSGQSAAGCLMREVALATQRHVVA